MCAGDDEIRLKVELPRITVLFIIHDLVGGGAERRVSLLLNNLHAENIASYAILTNSSGVSHISESDKRLFLLTKSYKYDLRVRRIAAVIKELQPDIINTWLPTTYPGAFAAASIMRKPYVISYTNFYSTHFLPACFSLVADGIITNVPLSLFSPYFSWLLRRTRSRYIPNPINIKEIESAQMVSLPVPEEGREFRKILFAGRITGVKNIPLLLQAFNLICRQRDDVCLYLAGEGDTEIYQHNESLSPLTRERIFPLGYRNDIYGIMKSADCIVLPSHLEGMPNVLCEAMAARLPIVASAIPVHRELLKNGTRGILSSTETPKGLFEAIQLVLGDLDEKNASRIEQAYRYVWNELSYEKVIGEYGRFYRTILEERS